ncbi:MAG: hypothetical protein QXS41_03630 [Candidatus Woesearchaeota archaeon]
MPRSDNFWEFFDGFFNENNSYRNNYYNDFLRTNQKYYENIILDYLVLEPELLHSEFKAYQMQDLLMLLNLENRVSLIKNINSSYSRIKEISTKKEMNYYPIDVFEKFTRLYNAYSQLKEYKNQLDSNLRQLISYVNIPSYYDVDFDDLFVFLETNSRYYNKMNELYEGYSNLKNQLEKWVNAYELLMEKNLLKEFIELGKQWKEEVKKRNIPESSYNDQALLKEFKDMHANLERSYTNLKNIEVRERYSKIYAAVKDVINSNMFPVEVLFMLKNQLMRKKLQRKEYQDYRD